jgi:hypothetical protein
MVGVWLDFDTSIIQPWPSTNKPHLGPLEGAATGTLADSATLHRPKCRVAGASDFYRHNVARAPGGILISEGDPWDAFEEGCRSLNDEFFEAMETRDRKTPQVRDFKAGLS